MNSVTGSLKWLLLIYLFLTTSVSLNVPRLSLITSGTFRQQSEALSAFDQSEFKTFYYKQTLDHFNFRPDSFSTFQQKYVINSKYWGGSKINVSAPIFAYLGAEESLDSTIPYVGFLPENAKQFQALLIYIEHRYYGKSIPFESREEAFKNASTLGYFSSSQALADYAEILTHVKKQLHAEHSPVIVIGASYGGMLASWFRLKYPHITLGALASSAPILYFDDIIPPEKGYFSIVTKDFREASETCYQTIKKSWSEIDEIASKPGGLLILSNIFHTCSPLNSSSDLKTYLRLVYMVAAQYDKPPRYPVNVICSGIDGASSTNDTLAKVFAGLVAHIGNYSCYSHVNAPSSTNDDDSSETIEGWNWQICSELVIPLSIGNNTMFQPFPFDLQRYITECKAEYGVPPRPHWVTTYYGGHDIKLTLKKFGSNIIFSNGLRDPYSSGGVLQNISDSLVAVYTKKGSHCLDMLPANKDTDPDGLVNQRRIEVEIIKGWINTYYADLQACKT